MEIHIYFHLRLCFFAEVLITFPEYINCVSHFPCLSQRIRSMAKFKEEEESVKDARIVERWRSECSRLGIAKKKRGRQYVGKEAIPTDFIKCKKCLIEN